MSPSFGERFPFYTYGLNKHLAIAATGLVGVGLNLHHPIARAGVILHQPIQLQQPAAADSSNWIGWCRFKPTPPSSLVGVGLNLHHPAAWLVQV